MAKIKNLSREPLSFHNGAFENGEPVMEDVAPGQTAEIAVDVESPQVKGRVLAGLIAIEADEPKSGKRQSSGAPAE